MTFSAASSRASLVAHSTSVDRVIIEPAKDSERSAQRKPWREKVRWTTLALGIGLWIVAIALLTGGETALAKIAFASALLLVAAFAALSPRGGSSAGGSSSDGSGLFLGG